jgi:AcrR family transcriptional regulator
MFGALFFLSQYLQFVLGYDALQSGVRLLPVAAALVVAAPLSPLLVGRIGTKLVVTFGLVLVAVAMFIFSTVTTTSGYLIVGVVLVVIGVGMALAMAPATDSIMGSLPPEKAGVGSAVNDTTREIGGALGVAILGSITASSYRASITATDVYKTAAQQSSVAASAIKDSVGGAAEVAARLPPAAANAVTSAANESFVHALNETVIVAAVIALGGALIAFAFLPARAKVADPRLDDVGDLVVATAQRIPPEARPRRDITGVVLQLLAEAGFSSLTFNAVATKAGVSTGTLERYWTSRVDMVVDTMVSLFAEYPVPDSGSFRVDAEQYLASIAGALSQPGNVEIAGGLVAEAARDPALAAALRDRLLGPRRRALLEMIDRAIRRGELEPTIDRDVLADLLVAPLYHRALITGEPLDDDVPRRIVDTLAPAR